MIRAEENYSHLTVVEENMEKRERGREREIRAHAHTHTHTRTHTHTYTHTHTVFIIFDKSQHKKQTLSTLKVVDSKTSFLQQTPSTGLRHPSFNKLQDLVYDILPSTNSKHWFTTSFLQQTPSTGLRHPSFNKLQALVYDILPLEEGAGKRCSECAQKANSKFEKKKTPSMKRRKSSRRCCRHLNPWPFDHESGAQLLSCFRGA